MKRIYIQFFYFLCCASSWGQQTLTETFGTPSANTAISAYSGYSLSLTYSGTGEIRNTTPSTYSGASASGNCFLTSTSSPRTLIASGFTTNSSCTSITITLGIQKSTNAETGSSLTFGYSIDGTNFTGITGFTDLPNNTSWQLRTITLNSPPTGITAFRFSNTSSTPQFRLDDITFSGLGTGCILRTPLPIELIAINAKSYNNTNNLSWQTATEKNNAQFQIERSNDGEVFSKIGEVKGRGNSSVVQNYTYTDASPVKGINYYRLRQVDFDGTESVSKTVSVNFDGKGQNKFKVYPTLVKDAVNVELSDESKSEIAVRDLTGRVILTQNTEGVSNTTLNLGALSSGLYILSVRSNETLETVKIYKQ